MTENPESQGLYDVYEQRLAEIRARREARRNAAALAQAEPDVPAEEVETPIEAEETEEEVATEEEATEPWYRRPSRWFGILLALLVIVIALITLKMCSSPVPLTSSPSPSATSTSWQMKAVDYGNDRWFANGLAEIKAAKTPVQAASAAQTWLDQVKYDPILLSSAAKYVLGKTVDSKSLFDQAGWATPDTVRMVSDMQLELAQADISVAPAPINATNTGVVNGAMQSTTGTISGDRSGIKVTLKKGTTFWIMGRCGNVVTPSAPQLKQSLAPKVASQDPYAQGNAPVGGGPNADPGPGQYIPPSGMSQPPSTAYTAPPPPTVTTIPTGSTSDSAPPPPPETSAPAPTDPATGYAPPPGM